MPNPRCFPPIRIFGLSLALTVMGCGEAPSASTSTSPREPSHPSMILTTEPIVDLGVIPRGGSHSETVTLTNSTGKPVTVTTYETSCHCTTVTPTSQLVEPAGQVYLRIETNMNAEPSYIGKLAIDVVGKNDHGTEVAKFKVWVAVAPPEDLAGDPKVTEGPRVSASR